VAERQLPKVAILSVFSSLRERQRAEQNPHESKETFTVMLNVVFPLYSCGFLHHTMLDTTHHLAH
jgi:hypothetical protein